MMKKAIVLAAFALAAFALTLVAQTTMTPGPHAPQNQCFMGHKGDDGWSRWTNTCDAKITSVITLPNWSSGVLYANPGMTYTYQNSDTMYLWWVCAAPDVPMGSDGSSLTYADLQSGQLKCAVPENQ
jgi:hypothetical protein